MKTLDATFKTRITGSGSTLARLCEFTLLNGTVIRITDADRDIVWSGNVYSSSAGFTSSQMQAALGASAQSVTVNVLLTAGYITTSMIESGSLDDAKFVVRVVDYAMPTLPAVVFFLGFVSRITYQDRLTAAIEGQPLSSRGVPLATEKFSSNCRADLGDSKCRYNVEATKQQHVPVVASYNAQRFTATFTDGLWSNGLIIFENGLNAGYSFEIATAATGVIALKGLLPFLPAAGDLLTMYQGCDKTTANCKAYSNILNFQGEPFTIAPYTIAAKPTVPPTPPAPPGGTTPPDPAPRPPAFRFPLPGNGNRTD